MSTRAVPEFRSSQRLIPLPPLARGLARRPCPAALIRHAHLPIVDTNASRSSMVAIYFHDIGRLPCRRQMHVTT
jgi:hypothetical protein